LNRSFHALLDWFQQNNRILSLGAIFAIGRFTSAALMRGFSPSKIMTAYGGVNAGLRLIGTFLQVGWG
jgi:fucose permease